MLSPLDALSRQVDTCMTRDRRGFISRLRRLRQQQPGKNRPGDGVELEKLAQELARSAAQRLERQARLPQLEFPANLPVVVSRHEIAKLIAHHQVVILCGATGSGKTTQLPKICLELGRGAAGMIGLTQPRRIAARSIADYLAADLKGSVGGVVGCKVRFHDRSGSDTLLKVMTDGILLAEIQSDRNLSHYDTLIIDEAHERSLNIDFLLGYIKRLLPSRPDLKVIISSATLEIEKFSQHFGNAPVAEVSGRLYPVEVRYRPPMVGSDDDLPDLAQQVALAVDELTAQGSGDVLVFLPGEREIRETAEALRKQPSAQTEILPLYARLSASDQNRVFHPPRAGRRIVLATNVAETSITVPGIRYVIDSGLARISRQASRGQVQRLPIERIAQSAAEQRKGRCGRLSDGICIRLYSEEDYNNRPPFTEPEILRSSLATVILHLKAAKLGEPESFPFVDPPNLKSIRDGERQLRELGALTESGDLTEIGARLARLPIDPHLGRMLLAGEAHNALAEVLIIATAMSLPDPRERPAERKGSADEAHRRFHDERSDFTAMISLWNFIQETEQASQSKAKFRTTMKDNFLSWFRVREWQDLHQQMELLVKEMNFTSNTTPATYQELHRAVLAGLLGNIGFQVEPREYVGPNQLRFQIFPGSALAKKQPKWLVAGELVETSRLFARSCAKVEPEWIEAVAGELCRREYNEPHWEKERGEVMAFERVTLFGLTLIHRRRLSYTTIDPVECRRLFIREGLVPGELRLAAPFLAHNLALVEEILGLEHKSRRRDLLVDEEEIVAFYERLLPAEVVSAVTFEKWRRQAERRDPQLLHLSREFLLRHGGGVNVEQYPGHLEIGGQSYALEYAFDPGGGEDGVSAFIPLPLLNQAQPEPFEWLVPGLLEEKILFLLKSLPKGLRRILVPLPAAAQRCHGAIDRGTGSLLEALRKSVRQEFGLELPADIWRLEDIPNHLRMNFKIIEGRQERVVAQGRDLAALGRSLRGEAKEEFKGLAGRDREQRGLTRWSFEALPEKIELKNSGRTIHAFPALEDAGESVALIMADSPEHAAQLTRRGLLRLLRLTLSRLIKQLTDSLPITTATCLAYASFGPCKNLRESIVETALERLFLPEGAPPPRDKATFEALIEAGRPKLAATMTATATAATTILTEYQHTLTALRALPSTGPATQSAPEIRAHLDHLMRAGQFMATPLPWCNHLPRYLKAARLRCERCRNFPFKDREKAALLLPYWTNYQQAAVQAQKLERHDPELELFGWMVEEYRVSLFAQELGASLPISPPRLDKQWAKRR